jgi:hypothetical protein
MWDLVKGRCTYTSKLEAEAEAVAFSQEDGGARYALLAGTSLTLHSVAGEAGAALPARAARGLRGWLAGGTGWGAALHGSDACLPARPGRLHHCPGHALLSDLLCSAMPPQACCTRWSTPAAHCAWPGPPGTASSAAARTAACACGTRRCACPLADTAATFVIRRPAPAALAATLLHLHSLHCLHFLHPPHREPQ